MPVKFTSRTLKANELNYDIVEKEILALLRVLNECYTMLAGRPDRVLTRHTTLAWLFRSKGLQGRLSQWAAILSPWKSEICRSMKGEEELLGAQAASITPRALVDAELEEIAPRKRASRIVVIPVPDVARDEVLHVLSFDGSAKAKREGEAYSAVIWQLPNWEIVRAASGYEADLTVNEAEYRGLLLGCSLLKELDDVTRLVVCGDSNLVIRQMQVGDATLFSKDRYWYTKQLIPTVHLPVRRQTNLEGLPQGAHATWTFTFRRSQWRTS
ncbi:hypothetical protein PF010_g15615 [Phytophthora fragariae]|uniref:Reverse transcriptase RNase H-like domain-containing protein n=1 Tax=Phytophthora fragariae TaxID=53985 RepID=A0A6A4BJC0_9STRA|nr:hypothetical protein PF003_g28755 [Phytophthora fragariae]KAE8929370.1 hypothetical protein PF009_g20505 [Phytophthora fragariae]KAE9074194.1 hypothetical protein PF007_g25508 [Phytophthora fragariae]KAE9098279.1 hypothetical protein PF010_g15615 [Phytophthora fragariae]KAE9112386.1 hypothetical protein PF006_g19996 [Phytophthora fragariae]